MASLAFAAVSGTCLWSSAHYSTPAIDSSRPARSLVARPSTTAVLGSPFSATQMAGQEQKVTVKVIEKDRCTTIEVGTDENLRKALIREKVDLYTLKGKMTNCGGGGSCGTCVVAIEDGVYSTNGRTVKEEVLLKGKPAHFRLACRTMLHGDCTIRTKPKE